MQQIQHLVSEYLDIIHTWKPIILDKFESLIRLKNILVFFSLKLLAQNVFGTTWSAAYPYKQSIEGQDVTVKAYPYTPYSGSPMIGLTKVYHNKQLLYTINRVCQ